MKTRQEMQDYLTSREFDRIHQNPDYIWLICEIGLKGFNDYTDAEIREEYLEYFDEEEIEQ